MPAWDRLAGILLHGIVRYGKPFDTEWPVASFMQTSRRALASIEGYSQIGIAFHKQFVWDAGGGPAFYVRGDRWIAWQTATMPEPLRSMGVRLWPGWDGSDGLPTADQVFAGEHLGRSEWLHEREWRLPRPNDDGWGWNFPREAVAFLVLRGPRTRDLMLQTLSRLGGDTSWVEHLPTAYVNGDGTLTGAEGILT